MIFACTEIVVQFVVFTYTFLLMEEAQFLHLVSFYTSDQLLLSKRDCSLAYRSDMHVKHGGIF